MDFLSAIYVVAALVCLVAFAFVVFHIVKFALNKVNVFRVSEGKKPFSTRAVALLSVASALSFIL